MIKRIMPSEHSHSMLEDIKPQYSYTPGDNILAFQKAGRKKLTELLGFLEIKKYSTNVDISVEYDRYADDLDVREIKFYFESEKNVFVPCYLFIPESKKPLPLIVALHGHSTGVHVAMGRKRYPIDEAAIEDQHCDFVKQSIKNGYATLSIEHRAFGERGGTETGASCSQAAMQALLLGRTLLGERVWDTKCAIDSVVNNFSDIIDTKNIVCLGYSGGGTVATYLSAIDERISVAVIVSAISRFCDSIGAVHHCPCNYVPTIAKYFDMGEICQLIAPRNLLILSGDDDKIFPATGASLSAKRACLAYAAYDAEDKISHVTVSGGHRFYPDETWAYINKVFN